MSDTTAAPSASTRPKVGVTSVVVDHGRVLMLRRQGSHGAGCWGLTGGHQEYGDTIAQTAVRETYEETGLTVEPVRLLDVLDTVLPADGKQYTDWFVECRVLSGTPTLMEPDKATEIAWVPLPDVPHLPNLFPPLATFLADNPGFFADPPSHDDLDEHETKLLLDGLGMVGAMWQDEPDVHAALETLKAKLIRMSSRSRRGSWRQHTGSAEPA